MKRLIALVIATGADEVVGECLIGADVVNIKRIKTSSGIEISSWFYPLQANKTLKMFYNGRLILEIEPIRSIESLTKLIRPTT